MPKPTPENWWLEFYENTPFELYMLEKTKSESNLHSAEKFSELEKTLNFITSILNLEPGNLLFDQCCGFGSISIPLAERGIKILGIDLCQKYINRAKNSAQNKNLECEFLVADAFEYKAKEGSFDAAINWWTSFAYAKELEQNMKMLENVFYSLKPGAKFVLDYPNIAYVLQNTETSNICSYTTDAGIFEIIRKSNINLFDGLREQTWIFQMPDGSQKTIDTALKMYMPDQIISMLRKVGFVSIQCYGSVEMAPLTLQSARCIFVAQKPNN